MTFLGSLLRSSPEDPTKPLSDPSLIEWFSGPKSDAGVQVSEQRVLGLPAYYAALRITAGALGSLPIHVYRSGTKEKVEQRTVLSRANPRQTTPQWARTGWLHYFAWGNAYSRKVRDGSGQVREVWPVHPSRVRDREVEPTAQNPAGKLHLVNINGVEHRWTPYEMLHLPYVSFDGLTGVRPLEVFRQSLGIAIAGDDTSARLFSNGSRLSGVLTTEQKLDNDGAARLKKRWKEKTSGVANAGDIAVLDSGAKFAPIALPPQDAQLLESRQWAVDEIGRMIGVPPHLIGNVEKSTSWGTGIEQQVLGWMKFILQTPLTDSESVWTDELLPSGMYVKHSVEGLLRGDSASRASLYHSAITDGWMTRNEVRALEDLDSADGLDDFIAPSNMTLISVDGSIVPLSAAGAADSTPVA